MRNIAFYGGNAICELGPVSDVVLFFDCVEILVVSARPDLDWSVLTDKLYRRYIDVDFLPVARARMSDVKAAFADIQSSAVEWNEAMLGNPSKTILNPTLGTLADVYARYFEFFEHCAASSSSFHETWGYQVPIRTIVSDMPAMIVASDRPLAEHDALLPDEKPFWLR